MSWSTATVRDSVQGAGFEFEDRGEKELKGVAGLWHLYALRLKQDDSYILTYIGFDRDMDPIRDDPRFEDVRRRAREEVLQRNQNY